MKSLEEPHVFCMYLNCKHKIFQIQRDFFLQKEFQCRLQIQVSTGEFEVLVRRV